MAEYSADRPGAFLLTTALGNRRIPVVSFNGYEALNALYHYVVTVDLAPEEAKVQDILLAPATLICEAWTGTGIEVEERRINGVISGVTVSVSGEDVGRWEFTLVPSFWRLTQSRVSRIFQDMSVKDVVSEVIGEDSNILFSFKLNDSHATKPRKYCTQYQETNFNFVLRLLEEEGLFFSFEQGEQDTVIICDNLTKLPDASPLCEVPWEVAGATASANLERVLAVAARGQSRPQKVVVRDFSYENPATDLVSTKPVEGGGVGVWQEYRSTGVQKTPEADDAVKILSERSAGGVYNIVLETSCRSVAAGTLFKIIQDQIHPELPFGLDGKSLVALRMNCSYSYNDYTASVVVRPSELPWRPERTRIKPVISGPQTAIVVGSGGDEVMTDEIGRVKVLFHWDRDYAGEQGATSCWIRVAQAFAGADHGTYFVPKVGDEVVVAFEEGDPDRPLIVGSVYNTDHEFPLDIGDQDKRSIFKTSQGFMVYVDDNESKQELYIETPDDKHDIVIMAGKEIRAESKDNVSLKAKKRIDVNSVEDISIEGDKPILLSGKDNITIEGTGGGTLTIKQGQGVFTVDAAGNVTIEGVRITIKASADVTVQGAIIKLN